jgi:pimeloyl-ACP methyl ester carboxylesterase
VKKLNTTFPKSPLPWGKSLPHRRQTSGGRQRLGLARLMLATTITAAFFAAAPAAAGAEAATTPGIRCRDMSVPVSLTNGTPRNYRIWGRMCRPSNRTPGTVQLLLHGATYSASYWDWPVDPGRYSYVRHATAAGYATFAVDRIGHGRSSRPTSTLIDTAANVVTAHQLVQDLRDGTIARYAKVITVGHSYGSVIAMEEAAQYQDVTATMITGLTHKFSASGITAVTAALHPAPGDAPRFAGLDAGYLTTQPNSRVRVFYRAAATDPRVLAWDESTKDTVTATEFGTFAVSLANGSASRIRVPVLLAVGEYDTILCGADGTDCSSATRVRDQEEAFFHPSYVRPASQCGAASDGANCAGAAKARAEQKALRQAGPFQTYVLKGAGHDINLQRNAGDWYAAANRFADTYAGPNGNTNSIKRFVH